MTKNVLITGAASGLGLELAKAYAARGDRVISLDKNIETSLSRNIPQIEFKEIDIADHERSAAFISSLKDNRELPDIVIFNAAIHAIDNDPFIDFDTLQNTMDTNMMSVFNFLARIMPELAKPCTFVFCGSGVVIFPNPAYLGYYLSKLAVTSAFDLFSSRYTEHGMRFKSVILGPLASPMLERSKQPAGLTKILRDFTTGRVEILVPKIIRFADGPGKRLYYRKASAVVLWTARIIQSILPMRFKVYKARKLPGGEKPRP